MEYKICEKCGEKVHARTLKCPNCNTLLTEASKIVSDNPVEINEQPVIENNVDLKISDNGIEEKTSENAQQNLKDYVYKAEVRHSLEYTAPLSNFVKVLLTAFSMMPIIGQFLGTFFGIFFSTYDDNDRRSFGKALIFLSIIMFIFYAYNLMIASEILTSGDFSNYLNNFPK